MSLKALRLTLLFTALSAPCALPSQAQETPSARVASQGDSLELSECVAEALKGNFDIRIENYNVQNAGENLTIAGATFTPTLSLSTTHAESGSYLSDYDSDRTSTRAGVSQKFGSGATANLSTSLDRSGTDNPATSLNPAYDADVSLAVNQPLLNGFGASVNKAGVRKAELAVTRAGLANKAALLDVINNVETTYHNLCYAQEQLVVRLQAKKLAQDLLNEAKIRKEVGTVTELDVLQAEVGLANAERAILLAKQTLKDRQDALQALFGRTNLDGPLGEARFPQLPNASPSFEHSYKLAREQGPDLQNSEASLQQIEIDVGSAKRNRLPSLDLDAAVGYNTTETSAGRAYKELPGSSGYNWQVGLSLNVPWGLRAEKARYRSALNNLSQAKLRHQQLEQSLTVQVRAAVRTVETNTESVEISAKATQLSLKTLEKEKTKFSEGVSTARRVLEAQDDLATAQLAELQAKVALRNAWSNLHYIEGSSLARYGVTLP